MRGKFQFTFLFYFFLNICIGQPRLVLPIGHTSIITTAHFSADGKKVITTSADHNAIVWDAASGLPLFSINDGGNNHGFNDAQFSPDGKNIVTCSDDFSVNIWNATTADPEIILRTGSGDFPVSAQFSQDGKQIAVYSDKGMKIIDLDKATVIKEYKGNTNDLHLPEFRICTTNFFNNSVNGNSSKKNEKSDSILKSLKGNTADVMDIILSSFSADDPSGGKTIVTISTDSVVKLWNGSSGNLLMKLNDKASLVEFSYDGKKIITIGQDFSARILDAKTGKLLVKLKGHTNGNKDIQYSPDGKKIFSVSYDNSIKVWNAENGNLLSVLNYTSQDDDTPITYFQCSLDGKKLVIVTEAGKIHAFETDNGKALEEFSGLRTDYPVIAFSPDLKKFITCPSGKIVLVWDVGTGKLISKLPLENDSITSFEFSPACANDPNGGNFIVTLTEEKGAKIWFTETGKLLCSLNSPDINSIHFASVGKYIITSSFTDSIRIWDAKKGKPLYALPPGLHSTGLQSSIALSPNGKKAIITYIFNEEFEAYVFDVKKQHRPLELIGHTNDVFKGIFSPACKEDPEGGKYIVTISADNTIKKWETKTGNCICTFFALDSSDYFIQLPTGYYHCTPQASKLLHYVTKDIKSISFEQLDIKYNRPDKVLETIDNTDTAMISAYRNAYHKRIKKLGIDTTSFQEGYSVPEADFADRDIIAGDVQNEILALHIQGIDNSNNLDRYNVWVNEVPVYGQRGINISKRNSNRLDETMSIQLSQGENRIETSVTNVNGTESYRIPLLVNYIPLNKPKEKTYFIGIGINEFEDSVYDLHYSTKDIRDLVEKFKIKYGNDLIVDTLFNKNVSVSEVKALKEKLLHSNVNDKVIVSYSGHGILSRTYDYYLSTYSVNFSDPRDNGLPYEELENLLDSIPARKKLMLIDACHSGEIDKDEFYQAAISNTTQDSNHVVSKGVILTNTSDGNNKLGLKNSFELMQSLFVNVGKSTGATIISAAAGTEFALEKGDLKNGVFTYCVMEAMDKYPAMKISELKKIVEARVTALTHGMQKPTSRQEAIAVDWDLW